MTGAEAGQDAATRSGIWLSDRLYIEGLSAPDRHLIASRISGAMTRETAGHFPITVENQSASPFLQSARSENAARARLRSLSLPARPECSGSKPMVRWQIMGCGLAVLVAGFVASHYISNGLAKPVDKIVAGSAENLSLRRRAEEDLRAVNRELEKALQRAKGDAAAGHPAGATERARANGERHRARFQQHAHADPRLQRSASGEAGFTRQQRGDPPLSRLPPNFRARRGERRRSAAGSSTVRWKRTRNLPSSISTLSPSKSSR